MKNKNYHQSKLKKQLREKKAQGIKVLVWELSPEKKEDIERLGYRVEPYLYIIRTKKFSNVREKPTLIKELHYLNKRGKKYDVRPIKRGEAEILDENGICPRPLKYKIYLC